VVWRSVACWLARDRVLGGGLVSRTSLVGVGSLVLRGCRVGGAAGGAAGGAVGGAVRSTVRRAVRRAVRGAGLGACLQSRAAAAATSIDRRRVLKSQ
jgi:hypothetical protein